MSKHSKQKSATTNFCVPSDLKQNSSCCLQHGWLPWGPRKPETKYVIHVFFHRRLMFGHRECQQTIWSQSLGSGREKKDSTWSEPLRVVTSRSFCVAPKFKTGPFFRIGPSHTDLIVLFCRTWCQCRKLICSISSNITLLLCEAANVWHWKVVHSPILAVLNWIQGFFFPRDSIFGSCWNRSLRSDWLVNRDPYNGTTWKVDGATRLYWFIVAPYFSPSFGSCATYFYHPCNWVDLGSFSSPPEV